MMKTFEEFQKSGRNVRFTEFPDRLGASTEFGRVYDDDCMIELMNNGQWLLVICNQEYRGDLTTLEKRLYSDWYVREHSDNNIRHIAADSGEIFRIFIAETVQDGDRKAVGGVRTIEIKNSKRPLLKLTWDEAHNLAALMTRCTASDLVKIATALNEVAATALNEVADLEK
jgi:hypothetical protein